MKRIFFFTFLLCNLSMLNAQDLGDALRYGLDELNGTARYMSMGGAFNALGGDVSALKINPASSAVFLSNQAAVSLSERVYKNKTNYWGTENAYRNNDLDLNQAGVVFVFNNTNEAAAVSRLSFGVSYDMTGFFNNSFIAKGVSNESISNMFLNYAQGVPLNLLTPYPDESLSDLYSYLGYADVGFNNNRLQTAYLGYETYLFDAVDPSDMDNTAYVSNVTGSSFEHYYRAYEYGSKGKVTFNGGLAIKDKFYFGLNLNSHFIDYRRTTSFHEFIADPSEINQIDFINDLSTEGSGFSFQVGGIARLNDMLRVSLAYESPTWYKISDETTQYLRTDSHDFGEAIANPTIVNVFPEYKYRTPGKLSAGVAAVFGKSGLVSFAYSYQDFSNTTYTSPGFGVLNDIIAQKLQAVSTFRIGGEYRLKAWSFRAGFRHQSSPYVSEEAMGALNGYSAGIGYNFGGIRVDLAYDLAQRDYNKQLLHTGFSNRAQVENSISRYVLTLSFPM